MKTTLALALLAATLYACQNDQKVSEVEQKRLELEAKRQELKDKKELVALDEEMKNVEAEMERVNGVAQPKPVAQNQGRIMGDQVVIRSAASTQASKLGNFNKGEVVIILRRQGSPNGHEAIAQTSAPVFGEKGRQIYTLSKGKAVVVTHHGTESCTVTINDPEKGEVVGYVATQYLNFTYDDFWYQVQRGNGEEGWVFGKFLKEI
ncbi:MAG: hypothetical protein OHK0019_03790 [Saprospiraceae bacterium]